MHIFSTTIQRKLEEYRLHMVYLDLEHLKKVDTMLDYQYLYKKLN